MGPKPAVAGRIVRPLSMLVALALLVPAATAEAAFPGANGKIAFVSGRDGQFEIYTMNPDGSGQTRLTTSPVGSDSRNPAWSPDGKKILYERDCFDIWIMNADGSGQMPVHQDLGDCVSGPAWSPDGQRFVFALDHGGIVVMNMDGTYESMIPPPNPGNWLYEPAWAPNVDRIAYSDTNDSTLRTANPDGSGVTSGPFGGGPNWAPDGSKIVFENGAIYTISPDWTSMTVVAGSGASPVWSPDKAKIAFTSFASGTDSEIRSMNADGTNQVNLTNNPAGDGSPDWQPLTPPGYARPRNASPSTFRLVPSYKECTAANAEHGAPLVGGSCNPAEPRSDFLTVGTPEANGKPSNFRGHLTMKVLTESPIDLTNGDQSDVAFTAQITDVRDRETLADYTGELRAVFTLLLTDRLNGPGGVHPGTVQTTLFGFSFACTPTAEPPDIGSTCSTQTTADAVLPGITPEKKRAIWQLGRIVITDGGADGDADTPGNTAFATQGLFAP